LDTTRSSENTSSLYDPAVALDFFQFAGKPQKIAKGTTIFSENRKGIPLLLMPNRIYLLLEGEVEVLAKGEPIATILSGEIFGEMASIGQMPRSASAVAKSDCRVVGLDDRQFRAALGRNPGFALMLMSIMIVRLRDTIAALGAPAKGDAGWREAAALDPQLLADLAQMLGPAARFRYEAGRIIMREGQLGVALFAVLEGRVAIRIGDSVVEKVGPGGIFGEMSLVERTPRFATAVAETECALLAMSRHMFLHLVKRSPKFGAALLKAVGERAAFMAARRAERSSAEAQGAPGNLRGAGASA
jgi:CRP/FNR family transcriptional regulator, cyclic AMP receptor protein